MIPLSTLKEGQEARVAAINGGRGCTVKLMSMDTIPGKKIRIERRRGGDARFTQQYKICHWKRTCNEGDDRC